jgi:hypothetical protein
MGVAKLLGKGEYELDDMPLEELYRWPAYCAWEREMIERESDD